MIQSTLNEFPYKSLLIGMLACTALVGCTNEDELLNNEELSQDNKQSYIAVSLKSATPMSRAEGATYENGLDPENAVKDATFFFFNANKEKYSVTEDGDNFIVKSLEMGTGLAPNVEEISKAVLVIEKSSTVPPQYILAVLNAPEALKASASLADLQAKIEAYNKNGEYFIMSNSAYVHAATGEVVVATELAAENIWDKEGNLEPNDNIEGALDHPVNIYVERVAAKVKVTAGYADGATSFATGVKTTDNKDIYAKIQGWKVTNIKSKAYLLKSIDKSWTDTSLGIPAWNDAPYFRSYWANTTNAAWNDPKHPWKWSDLNNLGETTQSYDYYYENTDANSEDLAYENGNIKTGTHNKSQLLVAADFVDVDGNAIVIAEWYGQKYTIEDLRVAIANSVKSQIFIKAEDGSASSITPADIDFFQEEQTAADNRYLSYAKLATASESKIFAKADGTTTMDKDAVNALLKSVHPAKIWKEGGYYYMDIKHLGTTGTVGEFGLVRNHLYNITIDGIKGLGTPVYDPEKVITPEKPESDESYIAARINILAWRVVSQNVTLE